MAAPTGSPYAAAPRSPGSPLDVPFFSRRHIDLLLVCSSLCRS
ncbi:hypothetical protein [Actinacidiphila sp. ITFR-21]|nr:hypothetical protein [Streptomyces sp. ITFR-21]WNI17543.1 hypothetical protein RLT57_19825 [Streptomyces sp. ITFR-21]